MFRFVHTADWQIGRSFAGLPIEVAAVVQRARLTAVDRVAEVALRTGARHVLVAGDVVDRGDVASDIWRRLLARMAERADLAWHLLPGNHDAATRGGFWERVAAELPANVVAHVTPTPYKLIPDREVWLLPAPLTTRAPSRDPTAEMDSMTTPPGAIRIGLAHGSIREFGDGEAIDAGIIAPDRADRAGLAYLALGDWHGTLRIGPRTWYSGTPEPDRFGSVDPGNVLAVALRGGEVLPEVERIETVQHPWLEMSVRLTSLEDGREIDAAIARLGAHASDALMRLVIEGTLALDAMAALERRVVAWRARLLHLEVDLEGLRPSLALEAVEGKLDPALWPVVQALAGPRAPAGEEAEIAEAALRHLLEIAAERGLDVPRGIAPPPRPAAPAGGGNGGRASEEQGRP